MKDLCYFSVPVEPLECACALYSRVFICGVLVRAIGSMGVKRK